MYSCLCRFIKVSSASISYIHMDKLCEHTYIHKHVTHEHKRVCSYPRTTWFTPLSTQRHNRAYCMHKGTSNDDMTMFAMPRPAWLCQVHITYRGSMHIRLACNPDATSRSCMRSASRCTAREREAAASPPSPCVCA